MKDIGCIKLIKKTMYCVKCGAELNEGVKFCSNCGTPVHRMESQSVQKNSVKGETSARNSTEECVGNAQKKLNEVISFAREKSAPFLEKGKEMISDYKKEIQSECESKGNLKRKIVIGLFSFAIIIILLGIWASSGSNGNNSSSYGSSDDYDTQYSFTSAQSVLNITDDALGQITDYLQSIYGVHGQVVVSLNGKTLNYCQAKDYQHNSSNN